MKLVKEEVDTNIWERLYRRTSWVLEHGEAWNKVWDEVLAQVEPQIDEENLDFIIGESL